MSFGLTSNLHTDDKSSTQVSDGESFAITSICSCKQKKPWAYDHPGGLSNTAFPKQHMSQPHFSPPQQPSKSR